MFLKFSVVFVVVFRALSCHCEFVTVKTSIGSIRGLKQTVVIDHQSRTISKFRGIPYGESTGGDNRFRKAIPKPQFTEIFDATRPSPACFQVSTDLTEQYKKFANLSEDCLTLDINVPGDFDVLTSLPVMVWIHGGGFVSGASAAYPAEAIAIYGDVVVVAINYRIGMFGFLRSANGKLPGNQGLWDQHLALKWIHEHIVAFHGNPDEITIFGQSTGAGSVMHQAIHSGNKGLFKRVIAQSGSSLAYWARLYEANAPYFFTLVGCINGSEDDKIACIKSKTAVQLQITYDPNNPPQFRPYVDGDFFAESPYNIVFGNDSKSLDSREFFASLDILTGVNSIDGASYLNSVWAPLLGVTNITNFTVTRQQFELVILPKIFAMLYPFMCNATSKLVQDLLAHEYTDWSNFDNINSVSYGLLNISSDVAFFVPALHTVQAHSRLAHGRTFFYEFDAAPSSRLLYTPDWATGANHADELLAVFGWTVSSTSPFPANYTEQDKEVARAMMTMWSNFAKSGYPNQPRDTSKYVSVTWPQFTMTSQNYMEITNPVARSSVKSQFHARRMHLWTSLIHDLIKIRTAG